jgi:predicted amidohydrolase
LIGFAEREAGRLYNTQAVLENRRVSGAYRKVMLSAADREVLGFSPGAELPTFEHEDLRFGIQICHDSRFPELAAGLVAQGARLVFSPHYNLIGPSRMDAHRIQARATHAGLAALYGVVVARSNIIATDDPIGRLGYGDSAIFSPDGSCLAEAGLFTSCLITADVTSWLANAGRRIRDELSARVVEQSASLVLKSVAAKRNATSRKPTPHRKRDDSW